MSFKLKRYEGNPILEANPDNDWEGSAVFNCSVVKDGDTFHMLYRAIPTDIEPYTTSSGKIKYKNYVSSIGYATSKDGIRFERMSEPFIKPDESYDKYGCEDPRITFLDGKYYIFYTAVNKPLGDVYVATPSNIRIALATTLDFKVYTKHGVVGPDVSSKAGTIFPEKIDGAITMLLTAFSDGPDSSLQIMNFTDAKELATNSHSNWPDFLKDIESHSILAVKNCIRGPEVGAVPVKTDQGWLLIYASEDCGTTESKVWSISAMLLDLNDPRKVLKKSSSPILEPEMDYELNGLVPNVTFPEGAVIVGDELYVYYGGADKVCCLATCKLDELLESLEPFSK